MPHTDFFDEPDLEPTNEPWDFPLERGRKRRKLAVTSTLVVMFFAGAAFTAGAGDLAANKLQANDPCSQQANAPLAAQDGCATDATAPATDVAAPAPVPAPDAAPVPDPEAATTPTPADLAPITEDTPPEAASVGSTARAVVAAASATPAPEATPAVQQVLATAPASRAPAKAAPRVVAVPLKRWAQPVPKHGVAPRPEIDAPGAPTIWLNRMLPDPTPPARRLASSFAARLTADAKASGVDWALMLGVLRASGQTSRTPAANGELGQLASRLSSLGSAHDEWASALALDGHTEFADQAQAFARYDRAVGLWALVHGLDAAKSQLTRQVLNDPAISIYAGGRDDLAAGRVDVRVIALIAYLRETFGSVTVSCLISGHRLYARPGVISAHVYGRAIDIADLGTTPILGNQRPGGVTEQAVRDILLLPAELQPRQVISLLGLGGPSFPLPDHADHVHVGF